MRVKEKPKRLSLTLPKNRPQNPLNLTMGQETSIMLKSLLPEFDNLLRRKTDLVIGSNDFCYDMDGWQIIFDFELREGIFGTSGDISGLSVEHYNEETDEETVFNDDDIFIFREDLESILRDLA